MPGSPQADAWVTVSIKVRTVADLKVLLDAVESLGVSEDCRVRWSGGTAYVDVARGARGEFVDCSRKHPGGTDRWDVVVSLHDHSPAQAVRRSRTAGHDSAAHEPVVKWLPAASDRTPRRQEHPTSDPGEIAELADLPRFDWLSRDRARERARAFQDSVDRYGDLGRPE